MLVTGVHNNPGEKCDHERPLGLAASTFDVELHADTPEGPLVQVRGGSATEQGWFSRIHDGRDAEPRKYAAQCRVFDLDGDGNAIGRVIDPITPQGGPGFDRVQYPSIAGDPPTSKTKPGIVYGVGALYLRFLPERQALGVGVHEEMPGSCRGLGQLPLFEGQLNTSGLAAGWYALKLRPHRSLVFLREACCLNGSPGPIVQWANHNVDDSIRFELFQK